MISINATLILQIINFLLLMWILNRILFKPIFEVIDDRENSITDAKERMARLRAKAEEKTSQLDTEMHEARKSANQDRSLMVAQASAQASEIISQAQVKAQEHLIAVQEEAEKQAHQARINLDDFKNAIVEMVFSKVLDRNI